MIGIWEIRLLHHSFVYFIFYLFIFYFFVFSRATPTAYGGSQARGPIGAVATGHSNIFCIF